MDFKVVIMAGGQGTRFWPLSREKKPKQFLPIISAKTMIEETVERLLDLVPYEKIHTIANLEQTQTIHSLLPQLPEENLFIEPQGKNTAPSLILATARIYLQNPGAVVAALPADHLIQEPSLFLKKLKAAATAAWKEKKLITFGIPPSYPATGYGYIQFSKENPHQILDEYFYDVQEFKEKPDLEKAKMFLCQGNYFWNSGMFLWQASVFARKLENYAPSWFTYWQKILEALEIRQNSQIEAIFEDIPSLSIDYALMEKAQGVLIGEGDFGWSDVGSWSALADIWPQDKAGNTSRGENLFLDSQGCVVYSPQKLTALIGVKDLIVVDTDQALLVCSKKEDQKVKEVVEKLRKKGDRR
ncbi:MAG: mannose-1-phosphate guanylyltransferase [Candidatus Aminicenantes bacterium]